MIDLKSIPMPEMVRRFITFLGVGAINTVIGLSFILLLSEVFHVHYMAANALGYGFGILVSFFMHRSITFRDVSHMNKIGVQFGIFAVVFAVGYSVQFAALFVMVDKLGWYNWFSQIVACGLYVVVSFTGSRFITFRSSSGPGESP
jgi:putative flippase GtrA